MAPLCSASVDGYRFHPGITAAHEPVAEGPHPECRRNNAIMINSKTLGNLSIPCGIAAMLAVCPRTAHTQASKTPFLKQLSSYDVAWNEPGKGSADSMPLGNGEIGLNVHVRPGRAGDRNL
jgi:hypothetical protein